MEDKGQKLYEIWVEMQARLNTAVDSWNELDRVDKDAWRMTADRIMSDGGL